MKTLALLLSLLVQPAAFAAGENYCLAVRGNGENVAAHWPAMARIVEENGLPEAMAGGSSASVSMFFLDAIAGNPGVNAEMDLVKRRKMQALLLKSLPEFVGVMARQDGLVDAFSFMQELKDKQSPVMEKLLEKLSKKDAVNSEALLSTFKRYAPLLNPELLKGFSTAPEFFRGETYNAVKVFGQFDARKDANLFVRPGLADFKYFAFILGGIADFYAGNDGKSAPSLNLSLNACADESFRKPWLEVSGRCRAQFSSAAASYLAAGTFPNKALFMRAGENLKAYPSTAVIKGDATQRFRILSAAYAKGEANPDYAKFTVSYDKGELGFGYWGKASELKSIERALARDAQNGDEKAKRFTSLGSANWFEVLATSPAEPGLASVQEIPENTGAEQVLRGLTGPVANRWSKITYRKDLLSVGGWSDLHPTGILKAAGCEHVVYLTRKEGDAIFSQQVFIRLTGLSKVLSFWESLKDHNDDGWTVSDEAARTPWNALYNLGNPQSSFNRALKMADAVYCTDWNHFQVFKGEMDAMTKEAYASPVFLRSGAPSRFQVNPEQSGRFPGCR